MPTRIELLRQAGFSDAEIGDWATAERRRMQQAGFADSEIDDQFGVTRPPPEVPAAFVERLKQGNALQRILGAGRDYAIDYFGDEPLGPSPESTRFLRKFGVFGDLSIPVATIGDAALRGVTAGIAGLGAGLGQAVEEGRNATLGPGPEAQGKAARDTAQFAQIAAMFLGTGPKGGAIRVPAARVVPRSVIALPRSEDFRNAAAAISGTPANFGIEQKLLRLWTDHGIHPTEVAEDALRDRTIGEALRSDSEKLPDVYVKANGPTTATSAPPNVPAQPAESVQSDIATVPAEDKAAPVEAADRSSADMNPSEPTRMMARDKQGRLIETPERPQRPFEEDYPGEPLTDAQGQLAHDIEGRRLGAKFIAGRRFPDEPDQRLSSHDMMGVMRKMGVGFMDARPLVRDDEDFRGIFLGDPPQEGVRPTGDVWVDAQAGGRDLHLWLAHEYGHAVDHFTRYLLSEGLTKDEEMELRVVYAMQVIGEGEKPSILQPENFHYEGVDINRELAAEGLRAYMTNPNSFKTVAPKMAARIPAFANENPYLKDAIQFNSLGAIGLVGAGARSKDRDDK